MKLVGYTRTQLMEDLGERDIEEQERALAEFCSSHEHELASVCTDEGNGPASELESALNADVDGLVITDPLVISDSVSGTAEFVRKLVEHRKHLFIVFQNKHIDPASSHADQDLIDQELSVLNHRIS